MKKTVPFAFILTISLLVCVFAFAGCASSQTETTSAAKNITLEEALQKSAETRQKINDAKAAYTAAKEADEAANASSSALDSAKNAVKEKIDNVKQQIEAEKNAWKETLSN